MRAPKRAEDEIEALPAFPRPESKRDAALALFTFVFTFLNSGIWSGEHGPLPLAIPALVVLEIPAVALCWRRRLEVRLLALSIVASVVGTSLGTPETGVATFAALYTIGTTRTWRDGIVAWGVVTATLALNELIRKATPDLVVLAGTVAAGAGIGGLVAGVVLASGLYMGTRRAYVQSLIDRAEVLEQQRELLERERDLLAREAIAVERARIARELHDVVAHHVSVMVIQAGAAEATLPEDEASSERTRAALETIRETGREALAEMRRLLGVLRESGGGGSGAGSGAGSSSGSGAGSSSGSGAGSNRSEGDSGAGRAPQPGTAQLPILVARMREAGVNATLEYAGAARRLAPGIDLSIYRVAQEALTNTLRHAGVGAKARLRLTFTDEAVTVECVDDGLGRPQVQGVERAGRGPGNGLLGMRERVTLFGGSLESGTLPGGGYRVFATFPLDEPASESAPEAKPGVAAASGEEAK